MGWRRRARRWGAVGAVVLVAVALAACGSDSDDGGEAAATGPWTYTDGAGKTVTLDERPTRIIAHAYSAAALMEFGIKPIAVYADGPIAEDVGLQSIDLSGIEVLGEEWGKIDVEKAAEP